MMTAGISDGRSSPVVVLFNNYKNLIRCHQSKQILSYAQWWHFKPITMELKLSGVYPYKQIALEISTVHDLYSIEEHQSPETILYFSDMCFPSRICYHSKPCRFADFVSQLVQISFL